MHNPDRHEILRNLHKGIWMDEILSEEFMFIVEKVLTKKERIACEMKIEGYSNKDIENLMNVTGGRLRVILCNAKKKFENMCSTRVSSWGWTAEEDHLETETVDNG